MPFMLDAAAAAAGFDAARRFMPHASRYVAAAAPPPLSACAIILMPPTPCPPLSPMPPAAACQAPRAAHAARPRCFILFSRDYAPPRCLPFYADACFTRPMLTFRHYAIDSRSPFRRCLLMPVFASLRILDAYCLPLFLMRVIAAPDLPFYAACRR